MINSFENPPENLQTLENQANPEKNPVQDEPEENEISLAKMLLDIKASNEITANEIKGEISGLSRKMDQNNSELNDKIKRYFKYSDANVIIVYQEPLWIGFRFFYCLRALLPRASAINHEFMAEAESFFISY